jgi:hypothetical protein
MLHATLNVAHSLLERVFLLLKADKQVLFLKPELMFSTGILRDLTASNYAFDYLFKWFYVLESSPMPFSGNPHKVA